MSRLGDLIVEHDGPITKDNFDWDVAGEFYLLDPADYDALRDELIELRATKRDAYAMVASGELVPSAAITQIHTCRCGWNYHAAEDAATCTHPGRGGA